MIIMIVLGIKKGGSIYFKKSWSSGSMWLTFNYALSMWSQHVGAENVAHFYKNMCGKWWSSQWLWMIFTIIVIDFHNYREWFSQSLRVIFKCMFAICWSNKCCHVRAKSIWCYLLFGGEAVDGDDDWEILAVVIIIWMLSRRCHLVRFAVLMSEKRKFWTTYTCVSEKYRYR